MVTGLNQEVDILGRTFHFQSELTGQDGLTHRFEVFVGGRVVATREFRFDLEGDDGDAAETWMRKVHSRTVQSFVERAKRYKQRRVREFQESLSRQPVPSEERIPEEGAIDLTAPVASEAVVACLQSRRLLGRLRERLQPTVPPPTDVESRLDNAWDVLSWLIGCPEFSGLRIDEQARCHLIRFKINAWLASGREPGQAVAIWSEIVILIDYLAEINQRSALLVYDRALLTWAIFRLGTGDMPGEVFEHLQALYGRDPEIDRLLRNPDDTPADLWLDHLRGLLKQEL